MNEAQREKDRKRGKDMVEDAFKVASALKSKQFGNHDVKIRPTCLCFGEMVLCDDELNPPFWHCSKCGKNVAIEGIIDTGLLENAKIVSSIKQEKNMGAKKPTNPKEALGIAKVPMHCVPSAPLLEVALAMMEGGRKYGTHNYREMGVRMSTYYDAALRHIIAWWEGEDIDPDSGVHHVIKAMACLFVLRDSMYTGNCVDDRPIKYPNGLDMDELNKLAKGLIEKYPGCAKPFLEKKL